MRLKQQKKSAHQHKRHRKPKHQLPNQVIDVAAAPPEEQKPSSVVKHLHMTLEWTGAIITAGFLMGLARIPAAAASAIPTAINYLHREKTGSELMASELKRSIIPCTNVTTSYISQAINSQTAPSATSDSNARVTIAFPSTETATPQVRLQQVDTNNQWVLPQSIAASSLSFTKVNAYVAVTATGEPVVTFHAAGSTPQAYFSHFSPALTQLANVNGFVQEQQDSYTNASGQNRNPHAVALNGGGARLSFASAQATLNQFLQIYYNDLQADNKNFVHAQEIRMSTNNTMINDKPFGIINNNNSPYKGYALTAWERKSATGQSEIVYRRQDATGGFLDAQEISVTKQITGYDFYNARATYLYDDSAALTFIGKKPTDTTYNIYVQLFHPDGTLNGTPQIDPSLQLTNSEGVPPAPSSTGFIIVGSSLQSGTSRCYLRDYLTNGTPGTLIPVDPSNPSVPQSVPVITARGSDRFFVAYQNGNLGQYDIAAQFFSKNLNAVFTNATTTEDQGVNSITGVDIEQLFYTPTQMNCTISAPVDAGPLASNAAVPANAIATYDASTNTLSFTTNGNNALNDMRSLVKCFTYTPAKDYNGNFNLQIHISDNGASPDYTGALNVNVTPVNDPTLITQSVTVVREGHAVRPNVTFTDVDNTADEITVFATNVVGGNYRLLDPNNQTVIDPAITQFTAAQFINGEVDFKHAGGTVVPSWDLQAYDGAAYSAISHSNVNLLPDAIPQPLVNDVPINEGSTTLVTSQMLAAEDADDPASLTQYTFYPQNGQAQLQTTPGTWNDTTTIIDNDIRNSNFRIISQGPNDFSATFTLSDGVRTSQLYQLNVRFNQRPTPLNHQIDITSNNPVSLGDSEFSSTDDNSTPKQLIYTFTATDPNTAHGHLGYKGATKTPITDPNQSEFDNGGMVYFIPDGSGESPSGWKFVITDASGLSSDPMDVNFNFDLKKTGNTPFYNTTAFRGTAAVLGVLAPIASVGWLIYRHIERRNEDCFASFVYDAGGLDAANFTSEAGVKYTDFIKNIAALAQLTNTIEKLVQTYQNKNKSASRSARNEAGVKLKAYAKIFILCLDDAHLIKKSKTAERLPATCAPYVTRRHLKTENLSTAASAVAGQNVKGDAEIMLDIGNAIKAKVESYHAKPAAKLLHQVTHRILNFGKAGKSNQDLELANLSDTSSGLTGSSGGSNSTNGSPDRDNPKKKVMEI